MFVTVLGISTIISWAS